MPTRFDLWCPGCKEICHTWGPIGRVPLRHCDVCGKPMARYYGMQGAPMINLGYVESHYSNQTDADIAKWQFTNA